MLLVPDLSAATAEALGYVRSVRPPELHAVYIGPDPVTPDLLERWRTFSGGDLRLNALETQGGDLLVAVRSYLAGIRRAPEDFLTVVLPEIVHEGTALYLLRQRPLVRLKSGLLREDNVVVADVPVWREGHEAGADVARPLIPQRTVTLVFVSAVHDATVRAVNYALALGATETRAVHFDLDPDTSRRIEEEWFDRRLGIPLDVVEAPFRDLTGPMLAEVHRYTARSDTLVTVVLPEFVVPKWRLPDPAQPERAVREAAVPVRGPRRAVERAVRAARRAAGDPRPGGRRRRLVRTRLVQGRIGLGRARGGGVPLAEPHGRQLRPVQPHGHRQAQEGEHAEQRRDGAVDGRRPRDRP